MWQLKCIQRALTKCISFIFTLRAHNALREWIPACILPASWHWRRRQLQRFKSISAMHSVSQSNTKTSSVFMSIHKQQQLQSCSSNHRLKPVLAVLDAKQRCKNVWKITVRKLPHIASSARCTGHLAVFVCSLRIEAKKKKLIAILCKQNVLVEVCSTLSHIISNVYLFFLQFKQKQLLMYVLLHIYQLLFNLLTLQIVDCDKFWFAVSSGTYLNYSLIRIQPKRVDLIVYGLSIFDCSAWGGLLMMTSFCIKDYNLKT